MKQRQRAFLLWALPWVGAICILSSAAASQKAPDQMTMNSKVYQEHQKGLVTFTHAKHSAEYKLACADCHHVYKDGKNVWKEGDEVQQCEACHSQGKPPTGKDAPALSSQEKNRTYHYSAIHENCVGCHKANQKAAKEKPGPTTCKDCHPQK